jgi:FkbM family methyltransferase
MVNFIKKILYKLLGQKNYLKTMHVSFFMIFDLGLLRNNYSFKYHYFVKHLINENDVVLDIGANLGYFAKLFSRYVGPKGRVICVEPVRTFFNTLSWGLKNQKNVTIFNYALGTEEKTIELILPKSKGVFRTGLAHVPKTEIDKSDCHVFETKMVKGSSLFGDLERVDYIKCDIEGYEEYVFPEIKHVISKHLPLIQIETSGSSQIVIFDLMEDLGYQQYCVFRGKLVKNFTNEIDPGDYLFVHLSKEMELINKLKIKNLI